MLKRRYIVFYDQDWQQKTLPTPRSKKYATFTFVKMSFKKAPMIKTKKGTKIDDQWLMKLVDTKKYDGIIAVIDGNALEGRNGVHTKHYIFARPFSVIQIEAKKRVWRMWQQKLDGLWSLVSVPTKRLGDYWQIEYTFDHELGHSLKFLNRQFDDLHAYVNRKQFEEWWSKQNFSL